MFLIKNITKIQMTTNIIITELMNRVNLIYETITGATIETPGRLLNWFLIIKLLHGDSPHSRANPNTFDEDNIYEYLLKEFFDLYFQFTDNPDPDFIMNKIWGNDLKIVQNSVEVSITPDNVNGEWTGDNASNKTNFLKYMNYFNTYIIRYPNTKQGLFRKLFESFTDEYSYKPITYVEGIKQYGVSIQRIKRDSLKKELMIFSNHLLFDDSGDDGDEDLRNAYIRNYSYCDESHTPTDFAYNVMVEHIINATQDNTIFESEKNKLITYNTKNTNINIKHKTNRIFKNTILLAIIFYTFTLVGMFVFGKKYPNTNMGNGLIIVSLFSMIILVSLDLYIYYKQPILEEFNEPTCLTISVFDFVKPEEAVVQTQEVPDVQTQEIRALLFLKSLIDTYDVVNHVNKEVNVKNDEVVNSLVNDYKKLNYANMRNFLLTSYKIKKIKDDIHFSRWSFFVVSIIGICAGLYLIGTINSHVFIGISCTISSILLIIYVLHQKQHMMRSKYNWDKLYWRMKATDMDEIQIVN
jgi:hypothetical protein